VKHFVIDECDSILSEPRMRADCQQIFRETPHNKQVMLFSATLPPEIRPVCKLFTHDPKEIFVDDEQKLRLHGLTQYVARLTENEKNRKLTQLLDALVQPSYHFREHQGPRYLALQIARGLEFSIH